MTTDIPPALVALLAGEPTPQESFPGFANRGSIRCTTGRKCSQHWNNFQTELTVR